METTDRHYWEFGMDMSLRANRVPTTEFLPPVLTSTFCGAPPRKARPCDTRPKSPPRTGSVFSIGCQRSLQTTIRERHRAGCWRSGRTTRRSFHSPCRKTHTGCGATKNKSEKRMKPAGIAGLETAESKYRHLAKKQTVRHLQTYRRAFPRLDALHI